MILKYKENISFADARKRVQPISDPSKNSYASVTQTPPQSARPLQPWARNVRPPTDFQTEIQFLKYILNYCLTLLDAIGNEQKHHTAATEDPVENTHAINTDDTTSAIAMKYCISGIMERGSDYFNSKTRKGSF